MTNQRMVYAEICEDVTAKALTGIGFTVTRYGQGQLSDEAREMLRNELVEMRWLADFLVSPPLKVTRRNRNYLVDAKYSWYDRTRMSIEMRSLLAARVERYPTFYVHSRLIADDGIQPSFIDFGVIHHEAVISAKWLRPCCDADLTILTQGDDPMRTLPKRCPNRIVSSRGSGTPFLLVPQRHLVALSLDAFADEQIGQTA